MTTPRNIISLILLSVAFVGCGDGTHALCKRAAECDYIEDDDRKECQEDLRKAVDDGNIKQENIDDCLVCADNNSCGIDQTIDCATECGAVFPIIVGSNLN